MLYTVDQAKEASNKNAQTGVVNKFDVDKVYGFIPPGNGGEGTFVH